MSVRIHVIGAYDASPEEFQSALGSAGCEPGESKPERFRFGSSERWQWAHASVWGVRGSDIDSALSTLSVPGVRVTSSDAVLWMLTVTQEGREPFRGVHHFTQVAEMIEPSDEEEEDPTEFDEDFPADELEEVAGINKYIPELLFLWDREEEERLAKLYAEEEADSNPVLEEYTDYGAKLPDDVVRKMNQQAECRAMRTAFLAHGQQIVDALERIGIARDGQALLALLTAGPLTEREEHSDLGNMPRFLKMLGIEGMFGDELNPDQDKPTEEDDVKADDDVPDWSENRPGNLFRTVATIVDTCPLTDLAGGPIRLTLVQVAQLHLMSHLCSSDDQPVAAVLQFGDPGTVPAIAWQELDEVEAQREGSIWQVCFRPRHWWYAREEQDDFDSHEFVACLRSLPDGTRVELSFLVDAKTHDCHRYAGTVCEGMLNLEQVYPAVTASLLEETLGIMDLMIGGKAIAFASVNEEDAARAAYVRSFSQPPRIRNGKIKLEYGQRQVVVQAIFFERLRGRGPWDITAAEDRIAADWQAYDDLLASSGDDDDESDVATETTASKLMEMMQQVNDAKKVPHSQEVIYKGRTGRFYRASMEDLENVSADRLARDDAAMAALGFLSIADMVADVDEQQEVTRCYAGPNEAVALLGHRTEANAYALTDDGTVIDFTAGLREFHTHFDDGTMLATNDNGGAKSLPKRGIFVRTYEGLPVHDLWQKHVDGIARFRKHRNTEPIDHSSCTDPARYAELADGLLARFVATE